MQLVKKICLCIFFSVLVFFNQSSYSQEPANDDQQIKLNWIKGPKTVDMGTISELKLAPKYYFLNGDDTRVLMEKMGNPPTDKEVGYITPESEAWFIVFEFDDVGYVKDDEKDKLDPDKILESYKEGTEESNKWRKENGIPLLHVVDWYKKPKYDEKTNNLEWAMLLKSEEKQLINYNIRYLGRGGVMEMVLVSSVDELKKAVPEAKKLLQGYTFKSGHRYSEFIEGDKIAQYGLAALITGGSVAAAAKFGLLKKFWKLILAGLVAIGAFIKKFFRSFFGMEDKNISKVHQEQENENTEA